MSGRGYREIWFDNRMQYKDIEEYSHKMQDMKVECKHCGRKRPFVLGTDRVICDWCGNYIFKNGETEFKYKLKEEMERQKRNER